jgi:hypothetical protein
MEAIFALRPEIAEQMSHVVAKRHLANDEAYTRATSVEQAQQESTLAQHIMKRIRSFFSVAFNGHSFANGSAGNGSAGNGSAAEASVPAQALS